MRIAVDLNDVLRDFTMNFEKYYKQGYDHTFDYDNLELWTNEVQALYPFKNQGAYEKFVYEDYAYELFGHCPTCSLQLSAAFNDWVTKTVPNIDCEEPIEIIMVSPFEYGLSIASTYFFLSKIGCRVREVFMPSDSAEIWNKCDVLITANPQLLAMKPEGKVTVKIKQEYNENSEADFTYNSFKKFAEDENNTLSIIEKIQNNEK